MATRREREDTYFPSITPEVSNFDRPNSSRSQPPAGWGSESPEHTARHQHDYGLTASGSWKRAGYAGTRDMDSFEGGAGERSGDAAARVASGGPGLVWPMHRDGTPAATGARQSRKKQS